MKGEEEKDCHINQRFRVQFETDVVNEYFIRDRYPGRFEIKLLNEENAEYVINLYNGILTLTATLPKTAKIGDKIIGKACITDDSQTQPFCGDFVRFVKELVEIKPGRGGRKPPSGPGKGNRQIPDSLSLPLITEVREEEWARYDFDKYSALKVMDNGPAGYDFLVNVDNIYLKTEIKLNKTIESTPILKAKFIYGLVLFGLAILKNKEEIEKLSVGTGDTSDSFISVKDLIIIASKSFAPIIIPMVDGLGQLSEEIVSKSPSFEYEVQENVSAEINQLELTNLK